MNTQPILALLLGIVGGSMFVALFMAALYSSVRKRQVVREFNRSKDENFLPEMQAYKRP